MKIVTRISATFFLSFYIVSANAHDSRDWLTYLMTLTESERLMEIDNISQLSTSEQKHRIPALLVLLGDYSLPVRMQVASELAQLSSLSDAAIPYLIHNFKYPNSREGEEYIQAVYNFGIAAIPELEKALGDDHWLIRDRACQTIQRIKKINNIGNCKQLVMR